LVHYVAAHVRPEFGPWNSTPAQNRFTGDREQKADFSLLTLRVNALAIGFSYCQWL
jgi:hypothetical protein